MGNKIICEWTDCYPANDCPTRILNLFTMERLQPVVVTRDQETDKYIMTPDQKSARKQYDANRREKKKISNSRMVGIS